MNSPQHDHSDTPGARLTQIEARILGSLVEKAATTPDVYPLTLNNIVLACNFKQRIAPAHLIDGKRGRGGRCDRNRRGCGRNRKRGWRWQAKECDRLRNRLLCSSGSCAC